MANDIPGPKLNDIWVRQQEKGHSSDLTIMGHGLARKDGLGEDSVITVKCTYHYPLGILDDVRS